MGYLISRVFIRNEGQQVEKGLRKNYYMQEYLEGYHFNNEIIKDCWELLRTVILGLI